MPGYLHELYRAFYETAILWLPGCVLLSMFYLIPFYETWHFSFSTWLDEYRHSKGTVQAQP
jgi:ABC-type sugar transport system permease subunit